MAKLTEFDRKNILGCFADGFGTLPASTIKKLVEDSRECERLERINVPRHDPALRVLKYLTDILFLSPKTAYELCTFKSESTIGMKVGLLEIINGILQEMGSYSVIEAEIIHNSINRFVLNRRGKKS
jgi:hypothetical protein